MRRSLVLVFLAYAAPALAGEGAAVATQGVSQGSDPCGFYRAQAYGRGLAHFASEMLWACEAIADRRRAAIELSERLSAAEAAIERYRTAVIAAGVAAFARGASEPRGSRLLGADDGLKAELAESTGTLAALEAIRTGF